MATQSKIIEGNEVTAQSLFTISTDPILLVRDEDGDNMAEAKLRRVGPDLWVYVDESEGYTFADEHRARFLARYCDISPLAQAILDGWLEAGATLASTRAALVEHAVPAEADLRWAHEQLPGFDEAELVHALEGLCREEDDAAPSKNFVEIWGYGETVRFPSIGDAQTTIRSIDDGDNGWRDVNLMLRGRKDHGWDVINEQDKVVGYQSEHGEDSEGNADYTVRDEGGAETTVRASSMADALDQARDWAREGEYDGGKKYVTGPDLGMREITKTIKGTVYVTGPDGETVSANWQIDPKEPPCTGEITTYHEVGISPSHGGFGEFDASGELSDGYEDEDDLLHAMRENFDLYDLAETPEEELEEMGIDDIRGRIHNEPDRVFGYKTDDGSGEPTTAYTGIVEITKPAESHDWRDDPTPWGDGSAVISRRTCRQCGMVHRTVTDPVNGDSEEYITKEGR